MQNQEVMVVYKWTAKQGKSEELKAIYREVEGQMKSNEPGALMSVPDQKNFLTETVKSEI